MQAAANYFATNMREKLAVEKEYPDSVFTTFNGSAMRMLFPNNLPIFYMYSLKKGFGVKPWFMNDHRDSRDKVAPTSCEHAVNIFAAESTVSSDGVF